MIEAIISIGLIPIASLAIIHHFFPIVGFERDGVNPEHKYIMGYDTDFGSGGDVHRFTDGSGWSKRSMIRFQKLFLKRFPRHRRDAVYWVKVQDTGEDVWTSE